MNDPVYILRLDILFGAPVTSGVRVDLSTQYKFLLDKPSYFTVFT